MESVIFNVSFRTSQALIKIESYIQLDEGIFLHVVAGGWNVKLFDQSNFFLVPEDDTSSYMEKATRRRHYNQLHTKIYKEDEREICQKFEFRIFVKRKANVHWCWGL